MAVNPNTIPRYADPPQEPERTPIEWMDECVHCAACERIWRNHIDAREYACWQDVMASTLGCADCECFED